MLDTSEANARQLASRARKHPAAERRDPVNPGESPRHETVRCAVMRFANRGTRAAASLQTDDTEGGRT